MTNRKTTANRSNLPWLTVSAFTLLLLVLHGCSHQESSVPTVSAEPPAPNGTIYQSPTAAEIGTDESTLTQSSIEEVIVTGQRRNSGRLAQGLYSRAKTKRALSAQAKPLAKPLATPAPTLTNRFDPSVIRPGEELWVIAKSESVLASDQPQTDDQPGSGAMLAKPTDANHQVPLPLQHTAVTAHTEGYVSTVNVRQTFANPFASKIEAVYLFPLPEKAAVTEFHMIIGDRKIRGILRDKKEAAAIYQRARAQGYQASLLVQRRPNVFEQKVANIEPGKAIDVDIKYFHTLAYRDGWYEFVFPTVVGPRFNPPGTKDPIVPVARNSQTPQVGSNTQPYLRPNERSAHDLSIALTINAGVKIEALNSTHRIKTKKDKNQVAITLANQTTLPNRDFVVRFKVAGDQIKSKLITYEDEKRGEGYFTMMVYPPASAANLARQPMEMVFVVDGSGSMSGQPLAQAKRAIVAALNELTPQDTFQIIRFSDAASALGERPLAATPANIAQAKVYLNALQGTGGTHMMAGVNAALGFPNDPERLRFVSFMTDGYIGNETDILAGIQRVIGESRIFSFGVGSSVNRYLLERMAKVGRGAAAFLGPQDSGAQIMHDFFSRISHPALTDLQIDWGGMIVTDVYPKRLPDLFQGRPVVVTGKYVGSTNQVQVNGNRNGESQWFVVPADDANASNRYLPQLWARLKIADLSDEAATTRTAAADIAANIRQTALDYQLMSAYTSFIAVDASRITAGDFGTTVQQALPMPSGVRYETTVSP